MSYEPIKGRLASRPFVVNAANEIEVKSFTGDFTSNMVFSASPTLTGLLTSDSITLASGNLTLFQAPTSAMHAVNKQYADNTFVDVAGDTMTGLLTLSADPTNPLHAATKQYVDAVATGLDLKASVRAATTGNITLSGAQTIDGVSIIAGDRVLVKDQTDPVENGLYVAAAGAWSRSADADNSPAGEVTAGMFTFVEEGTVNSDSGWILATDGTITLGTTALSFTQFSGAGAIVAGAGLTKTGNTLDVGGTAGRISVSANAVDIDAAYVGQTSITTLGTIATGVWNGTVITTTYTEAKIKTVTGTADRITITGTATDPIFNIAATYAGQASIVTLGTITTGTWSADTIAANKGGTGFSSYAVGDLLYADTTSTLAKLSLGGANKVLGINAANNGVEYKSILGTASRLSATHAAGSITLDIDAAYVGQTSITTLGTIGTGVWQGTTVATGFGGTGLSAIGTANQFLAVNSGASALQYRTLNGTTNQVSFDGATFTLSLPQDIHTGATPTFAQVLLGTPTADNHAATKLYVDTIATGLDFKASVRAATTANITLSAPQTIDGVSVIAGDRVLVKNQSTGSENGIYVVAAGAWTRALDADANAEVTAGLFTFVEEGSTNADTGWVLSTNNAIVVGTTALTFVQFSSAGLITASNLGSGAQVFSAKVGNDLQFRSILGTTSRLTATQNANDITLDISASYVGQTSITTLGTITAGVWTGTTIAIANGGTGATTALGAFNALSPLTTAGDLLTYSAGNNVRLGIGTDGHFLKVSAGAPAWSALTAAEVNTALALTASRLITTDGSGNLTPHAALTVNAVVYASAANAFTSVSLTNGQLLVGSAGAAPVAAALTGTANQVVVTNGAGSITLSLPQDIHSGASPTFVTTTLTGLTASQAVFTNGSGTLVSNAITGTGNVVMSASPTLTGTISAASMTLSGTLAVTGKLSANGEVQAISTKTANYTVTENDYTILVECSSADITITLPASPATGQIVNIKKIDATAFDMIISGNGKNIDGYGTSTTVSSQYANFNVQYNGTQWYVL